MCAHKDADCPAGLKGGKLETTGASINRGFVTPCFGMSVLKQTYWIGTGKSTNHLENPQAIQQWEARGVEGGLWKEGACSYASREEQGRTCSGSGGREWDGC